MTAHDKPKGSETERIQRPRVSVAGGRRWLAGITVITGRRLIRFILIAPLLLHWPQNLADGLSEAEIKAAYLYNFAKFVEWPEPSLPGDAKIVLCVMGSNVLNGALDALDGRMTGTRELRVLPRNYEDRDLSNCHMLFIGHSEQQRFLVILKSLDDSPVLTLSDITDFAEKGGGIGLLFRDNRVVFEVNLEPIRKAGLHIPGQLLNIASYVYGR